MLRPHNNRDCNAAMQHMHCSTNRQDIVHNAHPQETILSVLADLLHMVSHVPVLRSEVLPERIPPAGLMILREGNPGEHSVTLSPLMQR